MRLSSFCPEKDSGQCYFTSFPHLKNAIISNWRINSAPLPLRPEKEPVQNDEKFDFNCTKSSSELMQLKGATQGTLIVIQKLGKK